MTPTLAAIIGPVLAALVAYIAAARRLSGKIATSEADSLWKESADMRLDYRERIAESEKRQAHLEDRIGKLEERNTELARENLQLQRDNYELERKCEKLADRVAELETENQSLKNTIRRALPDA